MADVTAAAHPIMLAGREFFLSPLSDRDIVELDYWLQDQVVQLAVRNMSSVTEQRLRDEMMSAAMREASKLTWMSGEGALKMRTLGGVARVLYQGLLKRHPEIKFEQVREMVVDPATITYVNTVFRKINYRQRAAEDKTQTGSPKRERRRPRRR